MDLVAIVVEPQPTHRIEDIVSRHGFPLIDHHVLAGLAGHEPDELADALLDKLFRVVGHQARRRQARPHDAVHVEDRQRDILLAHNDPPIGRPALAWLPRHPPSIATACAVVHLVLLGGADSRGLAQCLVTSGEGPSTARAVPRFSPTDLTTGATRSRRSGPAAAAGQAAQKCLTIVLEIYTIVNRPWRVFIEEQGDANVRTEKVNVATQRSDCARGPLIDMSLSTTPAVSLSAMSLLFSEIVQYSSARVHAIVELEGRLSAIVSGLLGVRTIGRRVVSTGLLQGESVGARALDMIACRGEPELSGVALMRRARRDRTPRVARSRCLDLVPILQFIQTTVWKVHRLCSLVRTKCNLSKSV